MIVNIICEIFLSLKMGVEDLAGITKPLGFFDPAGLSKNKDDSTISWYRAAELKHGRVSMYVSILVDKSILLVSFNFLCYYL